MADNKTIAQNVLKAVGGKENVTNVTHCMTRLRLNLKDDKIPVDAEVKSISGVLGVVRSGGQYQVVIGQNVPKVYAEVCSIGGFATQAASEGAADKPKEKLTVKSIGSNILNYMAGSITPMIPLMMAAGLFKTLMAILGPDFLKLISETSDLYILLDFLYDAAFYFLPIFVGFNAAKKLGVNPMLGAYMGGILIVPDLIAIVNAGNPFTVLGIPMALNDYSQSLLPIVLSVWVLSYVSKFVAKVIPDVLSTIFAPFLTMLIMTPISLCALAPLGSFVGTYISQGLLAFGDVGGFLAVAVVAALWEFLVMTGMHMVIILFMLNNLFTLGYMDGVCTSGTFATFAVFGVALGAFLRLKDREEKSMSLGFFISGILGGVTEPALYGLCFNHKRTFLTLAGAGFLGGAYAGITHVASYLLGSTNVLMVMGFIAGGTANTVNGIIACALSLVSGAVLTYFFGFSKEELGIAEFSAADESVKASAAETGTIVVKACVSGKAIPSSEINDQVFSAGIMGTGVGIIPTGKVIIAPCDAEVSSVMEDSGHAVGLLLSNGAELLIHEGLETVGLNGEGFKLLVKEGDRVKAGDKLIEFDPEFIRSKGLDPVTVFLVTNSDDYPDVKFETGDVEAGKTVVMRF